MCFTTTTAQVPDTSKEALVGLTSLHFWDDDKDLERGVLWVVKMDMMPTANGRRVQRVNTQNCIPLVAVRTRMNIENTLLVWWQNVKTASPMTIWVAKTNYWTAINMAREQVTGLMTAQKKSSGKITD